uniref:Uncharacterized protein n=1 Tax=uncultured organism TaxID=155900 RepID=A0A7L9QBR8_9ZZZZ|nr:hypothetical protein [uncultured organism]
MSRFRALIHSRSAVTNVAELAGVGLISTGVALVFVPAAFIVAGVLIIAASIMIARAGE